MVKTIQLDSQQQFVVDETISQILKGSLEVSIGGLAGTGKTTISAAINIELQRRGLKVIVLCPTGKAANVLRTKGVDADTIHSAIYNFKGKYENDNGDEQLSWERKNKVSDDPDVLMIDEASMVNSYLASDLRELNIRIIWIGDHGQLPPVGPDPGIMRHPDFILKKNYRQGKSEIVDFALAIREGEFIKTSKEVTQVTNTPWANIINTFDPDQAIFGFNHSRVKYNKLYRKMKGYKSKIPLVGEKLICIQNNRRMWVFNGMQFVVSEIITDQSYHVLMKVKSLDTKKVHTVRLRKDCLNQAKYDLDKLERDELAADYSYGITCHKSQGSEWDNVLVFNQECRAWDQTRWLYTAATRAAKKLVIVN